MHEMVKSFNNISFNKSSKDFSQLQVPTARPRRASSSESERRNSFVHHRLVFPIVPCPSERIANAAEVLKKSIKSTSPGIIKNRSDQLGEYDSCMAGKEMVDWIVKFNPKEYTRCVAVGMWQALLEEGAVEHVLRQFHFEDQENLIYRFKVSEANASLSKSSSSADPLQTEMETQSVLSILVQLSPQAILRKILRKP
jgi:hypothetical protein